MTLQYMTTKLRAAHPKPGKRKRPFTAELQGSDDDGESDLLCFPDLRKEGKALGVGAKARPVWNGSELARAEGLYARVRAFISDQGSTVFKPANKLRDSLHALIADAAGAGAGAGAGTGAGSQAGTGAGAWAGAGVGTEPSFASGWLV